MPDVIAIRERSFEDCWGCGEPLTGPLNDEWPLCDDCVLSHDWDYRWCCKDRECHFNDAYRGRREQVWRRRALPA